MGRAWHCLVVLVAVLTAVADLQAIPRFVGSSRMFEISQPGRFSRQAPAVERVETAASFYDFYSASSHTGFEYTRRSLVFLYRDLRDEGNLSIFFLHGVDDMGQAAHLRQPSGGTNGCISGIPGGARVAVADDGTHEFNWSSHCNGRPTGNGSLARGYWRYGNNTDGGAIDRIRTDVDWEIEVNIDLLHGMDEWRYFMADGADIVLDTNLPLLIRSRAANAGDQASSAEGQSMTVCALAVDDASPPHLTYTFHWNDGSESDSVQRPPAELACQDHVFPDSGNYVVRIDVADPQGRGVSKNFQAVMEAAPPRLYVDQNVEATSEIATTLSIRAEDGSADTHESRWDFDGDGQWDTGWVDGVEIDHTFPDDGLYRIRVEVRDNEDLSAETAFDVNVALRVPRCGDTVTDANLGEQCDDGNQDNRDRCTVECRWQDTEPKVTTDDDCRPVNGRFVCNSLASHLTAQGPGAVRIDLSASIDQDSRDPLQFIYAPPAGMGRIEEQPAFAGNPNNAGPVVDYMPAGDGVRVDNLQVALIDSEGNQINAVIPIEIPNTPPSIAITRFEQRLAPPRIVEPAGDQDWPVESQGRGRYRFTLPVDPALNTEVIAHYEAREHFNEPLTLRIDHNGDGRTDMAQFEDGAALENRRQVVPEAGLKTGTIKFLVRENEFPAGRDEFLRNAHVYVSDGDVADDQIRRSQVQVRRQNGDDMQYRYNIDIGEDGSYETINSLEPVATFLSPRDVESFSVSGFATNPSGERFPFRIPNIVLPNTPPRFNNPRVVSQDGFNVVVAASANDVDGDTVTISVDWGDGNVSTGRNVIYTHSYANSRFQAYSVRLRATDGRGLFEEHVLTIDITRPAIKEADVSNLSWERMTEAEGTHDGVRGFAIDSAGTLFTHAYTEIVRRSSDGGETWQDLLADVDCCGQIVTRNAGEVFIASPSGLYFSSDNGDNWVLFDESKYMGAAVSPDQSHIVAATRSELKRFDMTGRLVDTHRLQADFEDMESCGAIGRSAFTNQAGQLFINDRRDLAPAGWQIPEARFGKGKGASSVSFDKACNLYQGMWNGYRMLNANNSIAPSSVKIPKHLFHISGSHTKNVYGGVGDINDILAWPDGAVIIGAERGLWSENEPWNAYRTPYWKKRDAGLDRSRTIRRLAQHPTNGYAYAAASSAMQMPKYCRKSRRNNRGRRGRGRRGRTSFYYVFCGFTQNFQGGLYRSREPLLLSRTIGDGGSGFDARYARGVGYDGNRGGLVVQANEEQPTYLWLIDTAASTMTKWDPLVNPPEKLAEYRVGLPQGECPGSCCHADGCNMPSRVAIDNHGDVYVASRGFGMQGTVTKIAGDITDCIDRNNDGRITTSLRGDTLGYGLDECILWTVPVGRPSNLLRALVVDQGDLDAPNGYPWVGTWNAQTAYKLDPETGAVLESVPLPINAYGMTMVANGDMYITSLGDGSMARLNTQTHEVEARIPNPAALRDGATGSYGVTTDSFGRIWQNGWGTLDAIAYDPAADDWCRITFPQLEGMAQAGRGITADASGRIWTALGGNNWSYMAYWEPEQCQLGQSIELPRNQILESGDNLRGPTAIGADSRGYIWLAHYNSRKMVRVDPENNFERTTYDTNAQVYSYSDFTGVVRRMAIGQGSYEHDFEADCDAPTWTALNWSARTPPGASISFSIQTAARRNKLIEARPIGAGRTPGDEGPINISGRLNRADVASRRYLRLKANLTLGDGNRSPVLQNFTVRWNCD